MVIFLVRPKIISRSDCGQMWTSRTRLPDGPPRALEMVRQATWSLPSELQLSRGHWIPRTEALLLRAVSFTGNRRRHQRNLGDPGNLLQRFQGGTTAEGIVSRKLCFDTAIRPSATKNSDYQQTRRSGYLSGGRDFCSKAATSIGELPAWFPAADEKREWAILLPPKKSVPSDHSTTLASYKTIAWSRRNYLFLAGAMGLSHNYSNCNGLLKGFSW